MKSNPIKKILDKHPLVLAPMAGVTDKAFRLMVRKFSPQNIIFTEMVSAEMLVRAPKKELERNPILNISAEEHPIIIQIFGHTPETIAKACEYLKEKNPLAIDINMGCPVPKIVNNQDGSALLKNMTLAKEVIAAAVSTKMPITVKLRLGWDKNSINLLEYGKMCEELGTSAVTIHARTRSDYYAGKADWTWIKNLKEILTIPVIGNGDVWTPEDALRLKILTDCDGIAVARGTLGNPSLLDQIEYFLENGKKKEGISLEKKLNLIVDHAKLLIELKGEKKAMFEFRKHYIWYVKGLPNLKELKKEMVQITSLEDIERVNKNIINSCKKSQKS